MCWSERSTPQQRYIQLHKMFWSIDLHQLYTKHRWEWLYCMRGNVRNTKFSRIASWTKFSHFYFRECLLRFLLSCQDGCRVYCFWAADVITADWLEEVLNCFWHVCPKAPYVLETCIDGKCSQVWRHLRNLQKFRIANISMHTVFPTYCLMDLSALYVCTQSWSSCTTVHDDQSLDWCNKHICVRK